MDKDKCNNFNILFTTNEELSKQTAVQHTRCVYANKNAHWFLPRENLSISHSNLMIWEPYFQKKKRVLDQSVDEWNVQPAKGVVIMDIVIICY